MKDKNKENYLFEEDIYFFRKSFLVIFVLLGIFSIWVILQEPYIAPLLPLLFIITIPLMFSKMAVIVDADKITVKYGYIKFIKIRIPLSEIRKAEPVTYKGLKHFGGWGIRTGRVSGERANCLTLKGNKGIFLTLINPKRISLCKTDKLLIESKDPQKLLDIIANLNQKIITGFE